MPEPIMIAVTRTYLADLDAALTGIPDDIRREIVAGVREELDGLDVAEASQRIGQLGDPQFIAAEAHAGVADPAPAVPAPAIPVSVRDGQAYSIVAALFLMVGGFVIPVLGAIVGLILVWFGRAWSRTDKWIATLVPVAVLTLSIVVGIAVSLQPEQRSAAGSAATNPLMPAGFDIVNSAIVLVLVGQIGVGIWLLVRARRGVTDAAGAR